jgi:threonine dehydrogenase-like Zn-dependent dehydrogenase
VADVEPPRGDGVRVKVASVGICGSDLHMLAAGFPIAVTLGHEMAGVTENGTPVAIEPIAPCGHCPQCVRGEYNLCELGGQMVCGVGRDGGMAEQLVVPERALVPLPAGVSVEDACLVEPLAVAVHGIARAKLSGKDRVAVVGGGSIGLCAVAAAKVVTKEVYLLARHDAQKSAGERLGARLQADGAFDLVVDCAGTAESLTEAVDLCRPGATLLMLATYWQGLTLPAFGVTMKELRLCTASMYCRQGLVRDIDVAASVLATNPRIADCIITHRLPLDAAAEAFAIAANRAQGAIKVILRP